MRIPDAAARRALPALTRGFGFRAFPFRWAGPRTPPRAGALLARVRPLSAMPIEQDAVVPFDCTLRGDDGTIFDRSSAVEIRSATQEELARVQGLRGGYHRR